MSAAAIARRAQGRDKIEAVINYMYLLCRSTRASKLVPLIEHEPAEIFWPIFIKIWPRAWGDYARDWNGRLLAALQRVGPHHSVRYLPESMTVYRGGSRSHIAGLAWTLNLKVARKFARGIDLFDVPDPAVAVARIKRSDAFWYCNNYANIREVICWPTEFITYHIAGCAHSLKKQDAGVLRAVNPCD